MTDNNNSSFKDEDNNQEIIGSQENKQNSSLTRLPKWYKALLICFIALPFSFMLGPFALVGAIGLLIVLIITFILGIKSLMQIKRSNRTPQFSRKIRENDKRYIRNWVQGCHFEWINPR
ncbi:MAG: hypothetical protein ISS77_00365 [Phycisphaerae bacterium]|nr:hypothetical protein [Phycisphaerae bacterium]